jgi:hypothetical protein
MRPCPLALASDSGPGASQVVSGEEVAWAGWERPRIRATTHGMVKQNRTLLFIQLAVGVGLIVVLASGLSRLKLQSGTSTHFIEVLLRELRSLNAGSVPTPDSGGPSLALLRPIFWVLLIFSVLFAIISPQYRRLLLRTFVTVLLLTLLLDLLSGQLNTALGGGEGALGAAAPSGAGEELPEPPDFVRNPPAWLVWVGNGLLALFLMGAIWLAWRFLRPGQDPRARLVEEAQTTITELEAGADLKNAVLRCYARMGKVLSESRDIRRARGMTPREFERHLSEIGLGDEHIQQLTRLFEGVRYGARPADTRAEREALDCLRAIVRTYGETA